MLMVEIVASSMLLIIALTVFGLALNRAMGKLVENNFAKIARVEAEYLDEQLRELSERNGY